MLRGVCIVIVSLEVKEGRQSKVEGRKTSVGGVVQGGGEEKLNEGGGGLRWREV